MHLQKVILAHVLAILGFVLASCDENSQKSPYLEGSPPHYVNPHYGLDVAIPADFPICVDDNGITMSHGFTIQLTQDASCTDHDPVSHPFVDIYVGFAADLDDVNTTEQLVQERCDRNSTRIDAPAWRVPGHDTAVCREPYIYHDIDGKLVAPRDLIATTAFVWAANEPSIELRVRLVTNEDRLLRDMETLKSVLDGIKSVGR
jgi:hypothetical protein